MGLKLQLTMAFYGIRYFLNTLHTISGGQSNNYAILQTAHRIEKGLCIRNPKEGWGIDKAISLINLIILEKSKKDPDDFSINIGESVLRAYINAKKKENNVNEINGLARIQDKLRSYDLQLENETYGGILHIRREDILLDDSAERIFTTRHSVRDFDDTPVNPEKIERAVKLALCSPSACNRQASQIYVISGQDREKAGSNNEFNADKYLIITGNMKAFTVSELNDWIVSTSVFCGYLNLALHAEGIGSCVIRKEIIGKSQYNEMVRKMCNIPDDEQIILEMAIGNYKTEFDVPVSYRRDATDVIRYIS